MSLAFIYWFFMLLWLIFGVWWGYTGTADRVGRVGGIFIPFVLFIIIGLKLFGFPISG